MGSSRGAGAPVGWRAPIEQREIALQESPSVRLRRGLVAAWEWLGPIGTTVQPASREVDLPHFATNLPAFQTLGVAILTVATVVGVVALAWRCRDDFRAAAAVVVAGGVLAAPHALPADLVLVAMALAIWGRAAWYDWLVVSVAAVLAAVTPAPMPAIVAVPVMVWVLLRAVRSSGRLPARQQASPR